MMYERKMIVTDDLPFAELRKNALIWRISENSKERQAPVAERNKCRAERGS